MEDKDAIRPRNPRELERFLKEIRRIGVSYTIHPFNIVCVSDADRVERESLIEIKRGTYEELSARNERNLEYAMESLRY